MNVVDKADGLSREGSGRVAIHKATGLPLCYTLECNYASGRRINHLPAKFNKTTNEIEPELPITDAHSKFYPEGRAPPYTQEVFEDCGRAFCVGLLDYIDDNPISRIPLSSYKTLQGIKQDILSHHRIIIPKPKEARAESVKVPNTLRNVIIKRRPLARLQSNVSSSSSAIGGSSTQLLKKPLTQDALLRRNNQLKPLVKNKQNEYEEEKEDYMAAMDDGFGTWKEDEEDGGGNILKRGNENNSMLGNTQINTKQVSFNTHKSEIQSEETTKISHH